MKPKASEQTDSSGEAILQPSRQAKDQGLMIARLLLDFVLHERIAKPTTALAHKKMLPAGPLGNGIPSRDTTEEEEAARDAPSTLAK